MKAEIWNKRLWIEETRPDVLKREFDQILSESGFTILGFSDHKFKPYGYSALWLLGESHFAVHTFPEENKTYIELSSCVEELFDNFNKLFEIKI